MVILNFLKSHLGAAQHVRTSPEIISNWLRLARFAGPQIWPPAIYPHREIALLNNIISNVYLRQIANGVQLCVFVCVCALVHIICDAEATRVDEYNVM